MTPQILRALHGKQKEARRTPASNKTYSPRASKADGLFAPRRYL